jgi:hypothetical protein
VPLTHTSAPRRRVPAGERRPVPRFSRLAACLALFLPLATVSIANAASAAKPAGAIDCEPVSADRRDKIVISNLRGIGEKMTETQRLRVRNAINMQFPALRTELRDYVTPVFCDDRTPNLHAFDRTQSDLLNEFGVVIETWGEINKDGTLLYYAVIPLRIQYFGGSDAALSGLYHAEYDARALEEGRTELQALFRDNRELMSFAALALGARHFNRAQGSTDQKRKSQFYDNARTFFCKALELLAQARGAGLRGLRNNEWAALRDYATRAVRTTAERALADRGYVGAMTLLQTRERQQQC